MMKISIEPPRHVWSELIERAYGQDTTQDSLVENILNKVKQQGDQALMTFTEKFDRVKLQSFIVSSEEIELAVQTLDEDLKSSIQVAKQNIELFHQAQLPKVVHVETMHGVDCWQQAKPIEKIGIYIPGGTAPLFSTVLMLAIPAKLAGCKEIILCSPPDQFGKIHPAILYTAALCGVDKIFKAGGAQAIAALAYGTKEIPKVYKIFGPGNSYVTLAKMKVQLQGVAIDMPAGPSEVLVVADQLANPQWVAIDLLSQAEHGADSQVVLVTPDESIIHAVQKEINSLLKTLPRKKFALAALENSHAVVFKVEQDLIDFINAYAPEHLILNHGQAEQLADQILNAGSVFIGPYTPESVGDYASGTNHTLPTGAFAKTYSGVNIDSFMKKITFQKLTPAGLKNIGPHVEKMAEAEHLDAHKLAVSLRLASLK